MKIASLGSPSFWTCWTRPSNYCTDVAFTANSAANSIKKRDFCRNLLPIPARMIDGSVKPKPVIQIGFSRDGTFPSVRGTLFLFMYKSHIYIYMHTKIITHTHIRTYTVYVTHAYIYTHIITHIYISLSLLHSLAVYEPHVQVVWCRGLSCLSGPKNSATLPASHGMAPLVHRKLRREPEVQALAVVGCQIIESSQVVI